MHDDSNSTSFLTRVGGAGLGALIGLAIGLSIAIAALAFPQAALPSFAQWVFGTAAVLGILGFLQPELAFLATETSMQFIFGLGLGITSVESGRLPVPDRTLPGWLKLVFQGGVALGVVVFVLVVAS